jgi:hypothetical protein
MIVMHCDAGGRTEKEKQRLVEHCWKEFVAGRKGQAAPNRKFVYYLSENYRIADERRHKCHMPEDPDELENFENPRRFN